MMTGVPFLKKLQTRLVALYVALFLVWTILGGYVAMRVAERGLRNQMTGNFEATMKVTSNFIDLIGQTALVFSKEMAEDSHLYRWLTSMDKRALDAYVDDHKAMASADILIVANERGQVLSRGAGLPFGDSVASLDMTRKAIETQTPSISIVNDIDSNRFVIYASGIVRAPKGSGAKLAGVVLSGYVINERFVDNIKKNTGFDLAFVRDRAIMATTFTDGSKRLMELHLPYMDYQMVIEGKGNVEAVISGSSFIVGATRLEAMDPRMTGSLLLAYPDDNLRWVKKNLLYSLSAIFAALFLIGTAIWIGVSRRIVGPAKELAMASRRLASGDMGVRVKVATDDEFKVVAESFNAMADAVLSRDAALRDYGKTLELEVEKRTSELKATIDQLRGSEANVKSLKGLIPVCSWCRKLRGDDGYWKMLETYVKEHTEADVTHGICPECKDKMLSDDDAP